MDEVRWVIISFYLLLVLQATAATTQLVRAGDEAYLSCENVIADQETCGSTTWIFSRANSRVSEELVTLGNFGEKKPNLQLSQNCSLVIRTVTAADAGLYHCQQFKSGTKPAPDALVSLAVVTLMEQRNIDEAKLSCSVVTYESCSYKVKILFNSNELMNGTYVKTRLSACQASVKCLTSSHIYLSRGNFLKCEVKDDHTERLFPFRPSKKKSVTTAATTETTILTGTADGASAGLKDWWWLFVTLSVVLVALLIIVVKVFKYKRSKGSKTNNSVGQISIPPMIQSPPETSQDTADPEDCVSYATLSIKANGKAQIGRKNDDSEDNKVIYTSVIFTP